MNKFSKVIEVIDAKMRANNLGSAGLFIKQGDEVLVEHYFGNYQKNTIYKLFSMTKVFTSVAILKLLEEGRLSLDDSLSKYIPAFGQRTIFSQDGTITPARKNITIRNLMDMTSGLSYPDPSTLAGTCMESFDESIRKKTAAGKKYSLCDYFGEMAQIPGAFDAGEDWKYGTSADVLGAVIEAITGMSVADYFDKILFTPLDMKDTAFYVPEEKLSRMADMYSADYKKQTIKELPHIFLREECRSAFSMPVPAESVCVVPPMFLSTGGGLYSTIEDYSHLSEMLLCNGIYKGRRILKEETVKFMRTPTQSAHLKETMHSSPVGNNLKGYSYNNLVRILTNPEKAVFMGVHGNVGEFGWDGLAGNFMWIDPAANLYGFFMIQTAEGADPVTRGAMYKTFYDALESAS